MIQRLKVLNTFATHKNRSRGSLFPQHRDVGDVIYGNNNALTPSHTYNACIQLINRKHSNKEFPRLNHREAMFAWNVADRGYQVKREQTIELTDPDDFKDFVAQMAAATATSHTRGTVAKPPGGQRLRPAE